MAEDGAGDGGALLLAAGERDPALAYHGLVARREALDIGGQPGDFGGAADLLFVRLLHAECDVLRNGGAEEKGLLGNETDVAPEIGRIQVANVDAVDRDRAG